MATSKKQLYTYENDYKEQHAKHVKRPALVTIKKPLVSKGDMEDVLMRLLNLHAKPTRNTFNPKGVQRGINGKAILVDYHREIPRLHSPTDDNTDGEFHRRGVFEINTNQSVYLSEDPVNVTGADLNGLDVSAINPDRISAFRNAQYGRAKTYGDQGFVIHVSHSSEYDALNGWFDPEQTSSMLKKQVDPAYAIKYSLYLLTKADHLYLKAHPKDGSSQREDLIARKYLFTENGFPHYVGTQVIYDPKDRNGVTHPLDAGMAKRVFGYLPKKAVNAYEWVFYTKPLTIVSLDKPVWQKTEENKFRVYVRFVTQLQKLFKALDTPEQVSEKIKAINVKNTYRNAYYKVQKILNEALQPGENYTLTSFGILSRINKAIPDIKDLEIPADAYVFYYKSKTALESIVSSVKSLVSDVKTVKTIPDQMLHVIDNMNAYVDESGERSGFVSMLDTNDRRKARLEDEAKRNQVSSIFLTTKSAAHVTLGQFKNQYYAILINKINKKYEELKPFIDKGIVYFPFQDDLDAVNNYLKNSNELTSVVEVEDQYSEPKETPVMFNFIKRAERLLFSSFSGFYVTSYTEDSSEVKAPLWNSLADLNTLSGQLGTVDYGDYGKYQLINSQNKDIVSISVSRSVIGKASAQFIIKNANGKYNYDRDDVLNRNKHLIEPMDEVLVFMPTLEFKSSGGIQNYNGKLEQVFAGVVNECNDENSGGYHSLRVSCECYKKYMDVVRTNVKPSACRDESNNNPVTAFIVPNQMYESVENWMPFMFAQALSYIYCQPGKTTEADLAKPLFTIEKSPVIKDQEFRVNEVGTVEVSYLDTVEVPAYYKVTSQNKYTYSSTGNFSILTPTKTEEDEVTEEEYAAGGAHVVPGTSTTISYVKRTKKEQRKFTYNTTGVTQEFATRKAVVGYRDNVQFNDPLFNYLWYKQNTYNLPKEELDIIQNNLKFVLDDYIKVKVRGENELRVYSETLSGSRGGSSKESGTLRSLLAQGKRVAYLVYKQRFSGITLPKLKEDRQIVGSITGTAQPTYLLQSQQIPIQLSNWKTNGTIINEVASRFNFIYYTDRFGTVTFTPYSLDLTTLNTNNYRSSTIDTDKMLITRSSRDVENDNNPQILKQQYLSDFVSNVEDNVLVNWLVVNGQFQVAPGSSKFLNAVVTDPVLIKKYGYRTGKPINIFGINNAQTLRLYGLAYMDRQNRNYMTARAAGLFDARMDINLPYYVPTVETIYYCENLKITYNSGQTCSFAMGLTFGKKPLLSVEAYSHKYLGDKKAYSNSLSGSFVLDTNIVGGPHNATLLDSLKTLFVNDNVITPTTYTQYKKMFYNEDNPSAPTLTELSDAQIKATRNASICCYNGYMWDNVSGISFEELALDYAFKFSGIRTSGLTAALVSSGKSSYMEKLADQLSIESSDLNFSEEEKNALSMYYVEIPAISDVTLPAEFGKTTDIVSDLNVPGIFDADYYKALNDESTNLSAT